MKKSRGIKTSWASLILAETGQAIVGLKGNGTPYCICFDSLERLAQALSHKTLVVHKWAVAAPRDMCILKSTSLPAGDLDEAAAMVEFEVPSLVPVPADEIVYGCTVAGRQGNLLNVLVYIIKTDALERYLETYKTAGIEPRRVTPDVLATHAWFLAAGGQVEGPAVFVLAGPSLCRIVTSNERNFQSSRTLDLDSDPAGSALEIAREVRERAGEIADAQGKVATLLAGPPDLVSRVEAQLRSADGADTVMDVTVVRGPRISRHFREDGTPAGDGSPTAECVIAAGLLELSVGSTQPYTNLIPRGYLVQEQRRTLLARGVRVGVMSMLLVALMWACLDMANRRLERACRIIQAQIAPIEKIAGGVDRKRQRLRAIRRQLSNRGRIAETLTEMYECTPADISVSELNVTWKQGAMSIDIKGQTDLLPTAFEYTEAVRNSTLLRTMQIANAQQIPRAQGGSIVEFKASCSVPEDSPGAQP